MLKRWITTLMNTEIEGCFMLIAFGKRECDLPLRAVKALHIELIICEELLD